MERFFETIRILIKQELWISSRIELILWNICDVLPLNLCRAHFATYIIYCHTAITYAYNVNNIIEILP